MRTRALLLRTAQFGTALAAGALVFLVAPGWLRGMMRGVAAYDAWALALLAWYWVEIRRTESDPAVHRARQDDPGRNIAFAVVLLAVAFGLYAAIQILGRGKHQPGHELATYALALGAVALGWLLIHTVFIFRYARIYYASRAADKRSDGGLKFPGDEGLDDFDFAYFSFVIGMTFQVSDVQVTGRRIRRVVLAHGIISFAYNTAILALGVNLVSNLLH